MLLALTTLKSRHLHLAAEVHNSGGRWKLRPRPLLRPPPPGRQSHYIIWFISLISLYLFLKFSNVFVCCIWIIPSSTRFLLSAFHQNVKFQLYRCLPFCISSTSIIREFSCYFSLLQPEKERKKEALGFCIIVYFQLNWGPGSYGEAINVSVLGCSVGVHKLVMSAYIWS